jgi:hypothetical protein
MQETGKAVECLPKTEDDGFPCYPLFRGDPNLKTLELDPDYVKFMARLKEQWEYFGEKL